MKNLKTRLAVLLLSTLCLLTGAYGQSTPTGSPSAQVPPPLIQFSNVATDEGGNPLSGVANITFSLYNSSKAVKRCGRRPRTIFNSMPPGTTRSSSALRSPTECRRPCLPREKRVGWECRLRGKRSGRGSSY
jgi:hypothetical protein